MTGEELKSLRKKLELSVEQCAWQVLVSVRTWKRYESGKKPIPGGVVELFNIKNADRLAELATK